jgi:hypothetical protein
VKLDSGLLTVLGVSLLLSGCISISYEQKFDASGSSTLTQRMDFTRLVDLSKQVQNNSSPSQPSVADSLQQSCGNYTGKVDSCKVEGNELVIVRSLKLGDKMYDFKVESEFPNKVYVLTVDYLPNSDLNSGLEFALGSSGGAGLGSSGLNNANRLSEMPKSTPNGLKTMGIDLTYVVEMPAEVSSASVGKISGKTVKIDLVEAMQNQEPIVIKSKELDAVSVGIAAGAVLVVIAGAAFLFSRKH